MPTEVATLTPSAALSRYAPSFTNSLPSHVVGSQWLSIVQGALKDPKIAAAAANDIGAFLNSVLTAARLGLEPGTEQFYLVPFSPRKGSPRIIQGIPGYQGLVELMYRAGAVSTVIVEPVFAGDKFHYVVGRDERPVHDPDWFAADRGPLIGAYAYAVMRDGATSKVVIIGPREAARAKASSASAVSDRSPWNTDATAMWMKTAARQLAKWVPTSAEYRRQQLRDVQQVADERAQMSHVTISPTDSDLALPESSVAVGELIDELTGEVFLEEVVDAEILPDEASGAPSLVEPGDGGREDGPAGEERPSSQTKPAPPKAATAAQKASLLQHMARLGIQADRAARTTYLTFIAGREVEEYKDLTAAEAAKVLDVLEQQATREALDEWCAGQDIVLEEQA